jgi:concentrative nucleoside transporter, CNT family
MDLIQILRGIGGIILLLGIAFLLSNNKRNINWKLVVSGLFLQIVFAVFIIKGDTLRAFFFPLGWPKDFFNWVSGFFVIVLNFTTEGARFVFGSLALGPGSEGSIGMFFAFQVLPTIIFLQVLWLYSIMWV